MYGRVFVCSETRVSGYFSRIKSNVRCSFFVLSVSRQFSFSRRKRLHHDYSRKLYCNVSSYLFIEIRTFVFDETLDNYVFRNIIRKHPV